MHSKLFVLTLALIGTALPAQAYRVAVETDHPPYPAWSQESPTQTSTFLKFVGGCCSGLEFDAFAYSGPHQVDLRTYCYRQAAVSQAAYATAGWMLDDVVFSGPAPGTPVSVRMAFEIFDTLSTGSPNQGLNQEVIAHDVRVYDATNTQVAYWNRFLPGGQNWNATATSMVSSTNFALASGQQILTGQPYRFDIRIVQYSGGNQGWTRCHSSVRLAPQPFVLPVGVTVDSAQGNIVANAWTPSAVPQIQPQLSNSEPVVAGNPLTVTVTDCGSPALGYANGDPDCSLEQRAARHPAGARIVRTRCKR